MTKRADDDPQKEALYAWEDTWYDWGENSLTLAQCRKLIRGACRKYGVPPPAVKQHTRSMSWCMPTAYLISMQAASPEKPNRSGKNPATALHEAAHHIAYFYFKDKIQDHGPSFLGIYMWLLESAKIAPEVALHASARKHGLRWRHLPPTRLRK